MISAGPSPSNPVVVWLGDNARSSPAWTSLEIACHYFGFELRPVSAVSRGSPLLVVIPGDELSAATPIRLAALAATASSYEVPIAIVGIGPECSAEKLALFSRGATVRPAEANGSVELAATATTPAETGYELRGLRFRLGPATALPFDAPAHGDAPAVLAKLVSGQGDGRPALLRLGSGNDRRYLVSRIAEPSNPAPAPGSYPPDRFGAVAPFFLLLRDAGGDRCWLPPCALANLTIDDPYLVEPYGCLSYAGLLDEMHRERFHATIGFIPWNYDRNNSNAVALVRGNPGHLSLAVHGNNHDRYEFFRYETRPGDNQRAKPLNEQVFNVRQALARLDAMRETTGLPFDRVMVFPHGICPADTLKALKNAGYWATFNYSNVPLGESPSPDPARVARAVNTDWHGFPAVRRAYPEKYPEASVAIDLFLGNPVLFMAHQDNFFNGIDAFTPHAHRVNVRQPAVRWTSLGEISRRLHRLRWHDERQCEVQMNSRHAHVENPRAINAAFHFTKAEPEPAAIVRVTRDGADLPWSTDTDRVLFTANLSPGASCLIEIHYRFAVFDGPIALNRSGLRRRALRMIADFRDLHLPRSTLGRLVTRRYYRGGKKRLTLGGLATRLRTLIRGRDS